jgi:hypothetical protein
MAPAAEIATGEVPVRAPPFVVVAQVGHDSVPVVVIAPPLRGELVATLVTAETLHVPAKAQV